VQQARLKSLLAELDAHPTPEAIAYCREVMGANPDVEEGMRLIDKALTGAWAAERIIPNLVKLRTLNEERMELGNTIHQQKNHPYPTHESEVDGKAWAEVLGSHNAGAQEVVFNHFCICVKHIRSALILAAEAVGNEIDQDDLDYLDRFRHLRNHYEHLYERLPGRCNDRAYVRKEMRDGYYYVEAGLEVDENDSIIAIELKKNGPLVAHAVPVTSAGMERIAKIVLEIWESLKPYAIFQVRKYFIAGCDSVRLVVWKSCLNPPPPEVLKDTQ
jgi:hypothetical protein